MSQKTQDIATILKEAGYSATRPRRYVFSLLEGSEPLSMQELHEKSRFEIDRSSLYRVIELFEQLGVVHRINIGWKYKIELSDKFTEHHHHLTCLHCQKVIAINEHDLEMVISQLASKHKFKPIEHQIEIQGYCADCRGLET